MHKSPVYPIQSNTNTMPSSQLEVMSGFCHAMGSDNINTEVITLALDQRLKEHGVSTVIMAEAIISISSESSTHRAFTLQS
eukprot:m.26917 g.26917  ORF g.26917 m.26917 type:complete len:81 (+) comp8886_c0_seq1:1864-2106(+)